MARPVSEVSDRLAAETVTITQLAAERGRCERTIYRMIRIGELPPMVELFPGRKFFLRSHLDAFTPKLKQQREEAKG